MTQEKKETRRGGLGRGLAALIPTAPEQSPSVGDSAADIIFGPRGRDNGNGTNRHGDETVTSGSTKQKRHSDGNATVGEKPDVSRETKSTEKKKKPAGKSAKSAPKHDATVSGESSTETSASPVSGSASGSASASSKGGSSSRRPSTGAEATDIGATYREIPLSLIIPNPRQPREVFDEEPLLELAHSIREFGLMQPIVVRPLADEYREQARAEARSRDPQAPDPQFEIIMGERRWRASQLAGLDAIPAIVRETSDSSMLRDALLENIHRVQLNPLEEAAAYQQLLEEFDVTQAELADRIGRSRPAITNMIRLLQLPVDVQRRVAAGVLTAGHARALLGLKTGAPDQSMLADRIVAEGLSVRATEEAVTLMNRGDDTGERKKREPLPQPEKLSMWADRLADSFDTKVSATMGKRKGRIVIEFGDLEDFDRIMSMIRTDED
ncbi:ParB/RepB/Spo0J family partition protein [uncultured Corynebacterium sp.]|uniref:ParB/RepB/Spo0J family partition protein n=1 Tax=uncultured Corynebacterium sp. TaxID=159447 RepID=UPI0025F877D5|nr:ParB/RepB/Spo0J family partition protein [uncultured Corynebacterium sp.]